jgi:hypothetical protein
VRRTLALEQMQRRTTISLAKDKTTDERQEVLAKGSEAKWRWRASRRSVDGER